MAQLYRFRSVNDRESAHPPAEIHIAPIAPRWRKSTGGKVAFGASSKCESDPKRSVPARSGILTSIRFTCQKPDALKVKMLNCQCLRTLVAELNPLEDPILGRCVSVCRAGKALEGHERRPLRLWAQPFPQTSQRVINWFFVNMRFRPLGCSRSPPVQGFQAGEALPGRWDFGTTDRTRRCARLVPVSGRPPLLVPRRQQLKRLRVA